MIFTVLFSKGYDVNYTTKLIVTTEILEVYTYRLTIIRDITRVCQTTSAMQTTSCGSLVLSAILHFFSVTIRNQQNVAAIRDYTGQQLCDRSLLPNTSLRCHDNVFPSSFILVSVSLKAGEDAGHTVFPEHLIIIILVK